jgi:hypothetical protein
MDMGISLPFFIKTMIANIRTEQIPFVENKMAIYKTISCDNSSNN